MFPYTRYYSVPLAVTPSVLMCFPSIYLFTPLRSPSLSSIHVLFYIPFSFSLPTPPVLPLSPSPPIPPTLLLSRSPVAAVYLFPAALPSTTLSSLARIPLSLHWLFTLRALLHLCFLFDVHIYVLVSSPFQAIVFGVLFHHCRHGMMSGFLLLILFVFFLLLRYLVLDEDSDVKIFIYFFFFGSFIRLFTFLRVLCLIRPFS